ncbi:glycosyltransferase family 4 protein [Fibrella aquatilis]|uniref:Glycosyltransferase family 4 protein n=1 Tax=Fibrella aquatilis TaxID=2817059 RepID=A0A939G4J5_9BACT|nr:glycosyltransferase family 1 protein [Fibrella aquatilis]MBO0930950.1 glycosyltransferase family 4 protein [Fibrella aquatilis]
MNILYDHQTFSLQTYGGISRYHAELIGGINRTTNDHASASVLISNNEYLEENGVNIMSFLPDYQVKGKGKFIYSVNQYYSIKRLKLNRFDVFHATYYDNYFLPYLKGKPYVVTFHDMIYEKFSHQYADLAKDLNIVSNKKRLAEQAAKIIAVSQHTKNDIVELLNIDPHKVSVIYHGSSLSIKKNDFVNEPCKYILYVGNRHMYKNFIGLLNSLNYLLKKYNIKLLCAGGGFFTKEEKSLINSLNMYDNIEHCNINDESLQTIYQRAIGFIFPSFYEGFGIPILEAFACGCPCVVSNVSSLPEVAGDAALYIDPKSPESIRDAVEQLITKPELRSTLIQRGYKQLSKFSWARAVNETLIVYQSIA